MSRRLGVWLVMLASAWGCSRGPSRERATPDTLSLVPLADSSAPEELSGGEPQTRTDRQPGQVVTGPRPATRPKRHTAAPRETSPRTQATQGYRASTNSADSSDGSDSTRAPAGRSSAPRPQDSATAPAAAPDTAIDARAAVGDSIFPAATPGAAPSATNSEPAKSDGAADSTAIARPADAPPASASPAHPLPANALPAGTTVRAILQDSINSLRNSVGQTVAATVSGDLRAPDGLAVLPSGSVVHLTIDRLSPARSRSAKDGELVLKADSVTAGGHTYRVNATIQPVPHELKGRGVTAGEVEKVGAGAAAGAVVGGVVTGKTKGAVVGGAVGAVGGAVVAAQTASRDVIVTPRTLITLILRSPIARAD